MDEERVTPRRRRLDDIRPKRDERLRVYFPGGAPPRVLTATGLYDRERKAYEMRDEDTQQLEFVPGWLVASEIQRKAGGRWQ